MIDVDSRLFLFALPPELSASFPARGPPDLTPLVASVSVFLMRHPLFQSIAYPDGGELPRPGGGRNSVWLESTELGEVGGRYSYLLWDPFWVLEWSAARGWQSRVGPAAGDLPPDPFDGLESVLRQLPVARRADLPPFQGGAAGHFSYELAAQLEQLPMVGSKQPLVSPARWAVGDVVIALDHASREAWVISQGWPEETRGRAARARERLETAVAEWEAACAAGRIEFPTPATGASHGPVDVHDAMAQGVEASLDAGEYRDRFAKLHRYLVDGHLYQANLSVSYHVFRQLDPWRVYRALASRSPAPYSCLMQGEPASIASASPELFLRRRGPLLVSRPIKGTRPRGATPAVDESLAADLLASKKDMAEHVMIVDVHRNDLGRVARFGSVRVTEPWQLESFATLHHMTSTIEAKLTSGLRPLDPVRAAFPAGSITGAPKIRAMEVLAELEPHARGAYTGALGWISPDGNFDLSVGIRTVTLTDSVVEFPAGGGVVIDSDAEAEYQESWDKARSLWAAIQSVEEEHAAPPTTRTGQ
jgi:para-aminobenzoate synthetase component 1